MVINNLFSIFDPSTSYWSIGWLISLAVLLIANNELYNSENNQSNIVITLNMFIISEVSQMQQNNIKISAVLISTLFFSVFIQNIVSIFPFTFCPTAHISITFTLSLSIWLSTITFGWTNSFTNIIIHLTPLGTPNNLINFMVLIETISTIIRPITLSVRLSANIVAGHLLMSLLSSFSLISEINSALSLIVIIILIILEIAVAIVQSYVLITLIILYQNETC